MIAIDQTTGRGDISCSQELTLFYIRSLEVPPNVKKEKKFAINSSFKHFGNYTKVPSAPPTLVVGMTFFREHFDTATKLTEAKVRLYEYQSRSFYDLLELRPAITKLHISAEKREGSKTKKNLIRLLTSIRVRE